MLPFVVCLLIVGLILFTADRTWHAVRKYRTAQIRNLELPEQVFHKLRQRHPQLQQADCALVADGLRQFFMAYLKSRRSQVAMPSQVVDDLWHEFILHTKSYQAFCRHAFGGFLHHVPATQANEKNRGNAGIRRVWHYACKEEDIDPRQPARLPLLFALDTRFDIVDGYKYTTDCRAIVASGAGESSPHCASHLGSTDSGCGGAGCSGACGNDGIGGGGGGGGGGGCGGGCGGGGGD